MWEMMQNTVGQINSAQLLGLDISQLKSSSQVIEEIERMNTILGSTGTMYDYMIPEVNRIPESIIPKIEKGKITENLDELKKENERLRNELAATKNN